MEEIEVRTLKLSTEFMKDMKGLVSQSDEANAVRKKWYRSHDLATLASDLSMDDDFDLRAFQHEQFKHEPVWKLASFRVCMRRALNWQQAEGCKDIPGYGVF